MGLEGKIHVLVYSEILTFYDIKLRMGERGKIRPLGQK